MKKKKNPLKNGEVYGVLLLNFKDGPGVPFLNFEGAGVPFLNFRGSQVPLLNFERGPEYRIPASQGPGPTFAPYPIVRDLFVKTLETYIHYDFVS